MQVSILERTPFTDSLTDHWIDPDTKRLRLQPAAVYQSVPGDALRVFCMQHARYGIPTQELIDWLRERIGDRCAIEVGAGNGDLGYHLGITETDSYVQQSPHLKIMYAAMAGQVPTNPPRSVLRLDAERAVQVYKPDVVVASWLTRRFIKGVDIDGQAQASIYGPEEEKILKGCAEYIHIGNLNIHEQKTLLKYPHEFYQFPWLVSRATYPEHNCIHIWKNPHYPSGRRIRKSLA